MSAKHQYQVAFFTTLFNSLEDAKFYVMTAFTRSEAKQHLIGRYIAHYIGDHEKLHSLTPILVDEQGNISFGRTRKFNPRKY